MKKATAAIGASLVIAFLPLAAGSPETGLVYADGARVRLVPRERLPLR